MHNLNMHSFKFSSMQSWLHLGRERKMTSFNIKQLKEINILRQKVQVFRILDSMNRFTGIFSNYI